MKKDTMRNQLQMLDFALQEAMLFLNSHPDDKQAMAYYQSIQKQRNEVAAQYEACFGPLTSRSNQGNTWEYIQGPWPWEGEENDVDI